MNNQIALFDPNAREALELMTKYERDYSASMKAVEVWELRLCPGAAKQAAQQAEDAFNAWLVFATFLDFDAFVKDDYDAQSVTYLAHELHQCASQTPEALTGTPAITTNA